METDHPSHQRRRTRNQTGYNAGIYSLTASRASWARLHLNMPETGSWPLPWSPRVGPEATRPCAWWMASAWGLTSVPRIDASDRWPRRKTTGRDRMEQGWFCGRGATTSRGMQQLSTPAQSFTSTWCRRQCLSVQLNGSAPNNYSSLLAAHDVFPWLSNR